MPTHKVHRSELRPLPMRITQLQFERLTDLRSVDGIAIQEHVRRALDMYLDYQDRGARKLLEAIQASPDDASTPHPAASSSRSAQRLAGIRSQFRISRR